MVVIEKLESGWRVYRVLPCLPSAEAAAMALQNINPDGFKVPAYDAHPGVPVSQETGD